MSIKSPKTRRKSQVKHQQILAAATHLFTENGYATTSMDLIAKQAEVSKQTVYSHFGNKNELFAAAIEHKCDSYHMVDVELDDLADPKAVLLKVAQRFFTMLSSKEASAMHKICAYETKGHPQVAELFYQAGPEKLTQEISQLMTTLHQQKALKIPNPHFAALQFLSIMEGEAWLRIQFNTKYQVSQDEIDQYLLSSVELFMRGYACS